VLPADVETCLPDRVFRGRGARQTSRRSSVAASSAKQLRRRKITAQNAGNAVQWVGHRKRATDGRNSRSSSASATR